MRKIKYRAWDKRTSEMVKALGYLEPRFIVCDGRREYERYGDNLVLMQYTGMSDRGGVEICEGDIVEVRYFGEPYYFTEVVFECGSFLCRGGGTPGYLLCEHLDERVIGNIYENPELLQRKE